MAFNLTRFGSNSSNIKSIFGGVNRYYYHNADGNTLTTPGYFPNNLGLEVGDRIQVVPKVKTNPEELYVVSSITNGVVTVTQIDTDGAVDSVNGKTGHVVLDASDVNAMPQYETMPTASESNVGTVAQFKGTTDASYTHDYVYECVATPVYDSTVEFNPASLSGTTAACSGSDFAALVARWGTGAIDTIIKGTLTYDESGELLVFVGQDDTNPTVCTFQLYVQDYVDAGFTFTGTFQDGDVIAFTCTIEETGATYAWVRQDVQPQPAKELPTQAGNSGKILKTNGVSASWESIESCLKNLTGYDATKTQTLKNVQDVLTWVDD